ncbi:DNA-binding response regulator [Polaribacter sp. ALD11]|uniref:LytR/AlgR family response regulator transcription factor n=1 Tax=Polaribacter sp. ALD11 TaxID=2058137 RepID=UPI000C301A3C|nr:LytTR family DNA-binding domain-containing protein [Polaribacter sp. ALD11]AUC83888.1 DNA-binding response regulator [Polaribacter sp. ALD11]
MYRILIIEDEAPTRKKLKRYIAQACSSYEIVAELETVTDTKFLLSQTHHFDLIFSDIELRDGNVFEVYNDVSLNCPIIFTTAYNEFLMNAFEANGIEYLLKPYSFERFSNAWDKFIRLKENSPVNYNKLIGRINNLVKESQENLIEYKDQFAIKTAKGIYFLKVDTIVYFKADNGVIFAFDEMNKRHLMPQTVFKEIEPFLDPKKFFRINRSENVQRKFIDKLERYNKNTVSIYLNSESKIVRTSQNTTGAFNTWLGI